MRMPSIVLTIGLPLLVLTLMYNAEVFETGLRGLWGSFMSVWRTLHPRGRR